MRLDKTGEWDRVIACPKCQHEMPLEEYQCVVCGYQFPQHDNEEDLNEEE